MTRAEIERRLAEIRAIVDKGEATEEIVTELQTLIKEERTLIEREAEARAAFEGRGATATPEQRKAELELIEQRVAQLKEGRTISIANTDILHITHQSQDIKPAFNEVSELVDAVRLLNLNGGETYQQAYLKNFGTAGYTAEGADANASEPSWDYAEVKKTKITAYTEVPEEFENLAPQFYLPMIQRNLTVALRKKLSTEILFGTGATGHITGILTTAATAILAADDISISAIDENTLDTIVFSYGGSEEFSFGTLVLSKDDLLVFAKVRGTNEKRKVYDINKRERTIDGVPYILNSNITALASATAGDYVMAYGSLQNYDLASFSAIEISKSTDYKFKTGQIAYKIVGWFGGNVTSYKGFQRVKKSA